VCCALSFSALTLAAAIVWGQNRGGQVVKRDTQAVAQMVDDIANRNRAPKFVDGPTHPVPLFPEDYDWGEQDRVRAALGELLKDTTDELWEELVRKQDDPRYSLTTRGRNDRPYNRSVGYYCRDIARGRLVDVFRRHLPRDPNKDGWPVSVDIGIKKLAEWRKERKDKSLYQLQIETCELALKQLPEVEGVPEKEKDLARAGIEAEIENLKRRKGPIFRDYGLDGIETYTAEEAKAVRDTFGPKK
jgi:hypothetical protein